MTQFQAPPELIVALLALLGCTIAAHRTWTLSDKAVAFVALALFSAFVL